MPRHYLLFSLILLVILQIVSSIYYSQQIVHLNLLTQNQQQQLKQLILENQQLTIDWAKLNRLQILKDYAIKNGLGPINQSIDISHE